MADWVAKGASLIEGMEIRLKSIAEAGAEDILWCDGIALGSPTHLGGIAAEMKKFWKITSTCGKD